MDRNIITQADVDARNRVTRDNHFREMVKAAADSTPRTQTPDDLIALSDMLRAQAELCEDKISARVFFGIQHAHDKPRSGAMLVIWESVPNE